jgi:hypothetical protein
MKEGHNKVLMQNPYAEPRAREYSNLNWFVYDTESSLILGDIGCLFEVNGARRFKPISDKDDEILSIFVPISSRKLLVGTYSAIMPRIDIRALNENVARCSYEYFVCAEASEDHSRLAASIGESSGILSKDELDQLLGEIIADIDAAKVRED